MQRNDWTVSREADYSSFPKGLMYGIDVFDSWLYDESKPFDQLMRLDIYKKLKEKAGTGYFEDLIRKYLLDNTHASVVVVNPKRGLAAQRDAQLEKKLEQCYGGSSRKAVLVAYQNALKRYQMMRRGGKKEPV